jgi:hypothetical protein
VVDHLTRKPEALSSNPSTEKKKGERERQRERERENFWLSSCFVSYCFLGLDLLGVTPTPL